MARPLRIEYPGAVYHITSHGNARQDISLDDADQTMFLEILGQAVDRFNWLCHVYCLMGEFQGHTAKPPLGVPWNEYCVPGTLGMSTASPRLPDLSLRGRS